MLFWLHQTYCSDAVVIISWNKTTIYSPPHCHFHNVAEMASTSLIHHLFTERCDLKKQPTPPPRTVTEERGADIIEVKQKGSVTLASYSKGRAKRKTTLNVTASAAPVKARTYMSAKGQFIVASFTFYVFIWALSLRFCRWDTRWIFIMLV